MHLTKKVPFGHNKIAEANAIQLHDSVREIISIRITEFDADDSNQIRSVIEIEEHDLDLPFNAHLTAFFDSLDWSEECQNAQDAQLTIHDRIFDNGNCYGVEVRELVGY